jgi:AAA+ ATPase superfamily predicted ATPase
MEKLQGRKEEQKILAQVLKSTSAELVAVYGRRRVGKTFLIRTFFNPHLVFEFTGVHEAGMADQLQHFTTTLQQAMKSPVPIAVPTSWIQAFSYLDQYLDSLPKNKPAVLFFDEFPWIHTQKSGFLQAFDHWWNHSATRKSHIKVVICGSAASWMIDKILNNRGGLHNRVTRRIRLLPFTMAETEQYLHSRAVKLDHYRLLQLYMALGGIPHYLYTIEKGESTAQIIDRLCFAKDGLLKNEFTNLYESLFSNPQHHEVVVRALSKKGKGLTRNEIIDVCGFTSGGGITQILTELEESGFISSYIPFNRSEKDAIYKLSDEYSLFYLKFMEGSKDTGAGSWLRQIKSPSYISWSGIAFESVCQKHTPQIKKALGIEAVYTQVSTWRYVPAKGKQGAQIDLLLDRADGCINLCEMKFANTQFTIDKKYSNELQNKVNVFEEETKTKKTIFTTMITTYGVKANEHSIAKVQAEVIMDDLFA